MVLNKNPIWADLIQVREIVDSNDFVRYNRQFCVFVTGVKLGLTFVQAVISRIMSECNLAGNRGTCDSSRFKNGRHRFDDGRVETRLRHLRMPNVS